MQRNAGSSAGGRPEPDDRGDRIFLRRFVKALLVVAFALLLYRLAHVVLLIFGAALIAVILRSIADPLTRRTGVSDRLGLLAAILVVVGVLALAGWLFGSQLAAEVQQLRQTLPDAWHTFEERLGRSDLGERILQELRDSAPDARGVASSLGSYALTFGSAVADLILVLIAGIFLAAEPRLCRRGALKVIPDDRQEEIGKALDNSGGALRLWLLGQLFSMTVIGVLTGIGLSLVGVPSALALGLLAGLAEFVPLVGPIVSAIPGLLLALTVGPETALWALLVYFGIQQIESYLLTPLVERRAVSLPPVVTLFAILALGVLFGPLGVLLGAPLAVVIYVFVKQLYVRDALGHDTEIPGETKEKNS